MNVKESTVLKAVIHFRRMSFPRKEMFCKDYFMKEHGEQDQLLLWLRMSFPSDGFTAMCTASLLMELFLETLVKDFRKIES